MAGAAILERQTIETAMVEAGSQTVARADPGQMEATGKVGAAGVGPAERLLNFPDGWRALQALWMGFPAVGCFNHATRIFDDHFPEEIFDAALATIQIGSLAGLLHPGQVELQEGKEPGDDHNLDEDHAF